MAKLLPKQSNSRGRSYQSSMCDFVASMWLDRAKALFCYPVASLVSALSILSLFDLR